MLTPVAWGGGGCHYAGRRVDCKRLHFLAAWGEGGGGHHCGGFSIAIALLINDSSLLLLMNVATVVAHPRPLHFVCMPPPPIISPSHHALPHASILAPPLHLHQLVVASPLVASASASALASASTSAFVLSSTAPPLDTPLPHVAPATPPLSAPLTMTARGPHHSCSRSQSRRHCPLYCWRFTALITMGPCPSSYTTALMSADACVGGLRLCPPP